MDTSLENIRQEPKDKKRDSDRKNRKKLREMENPVWGFMWRFLLCCAVIDIPVWAYFHFMKDDSSITRKINKRSHYQSTKIEHYEPAEKITNDEEISKYKNLIQVEEKHHKEEHPIERKIPSDQEKFDDKVNYAAHLIKKRQMEGKDSKRKYPGIIYSWKNEKGMKVYSNIGFPKDEKFTEPEMH